MAAARLLRAAEAFMAASIGEAASMPAGPVIGEGFTLAVRIIIAADITVAVSMGGGEPISAAEAFTADARS